LYGAHGSEEGSVNDVASEPGAGSGPARPRGLDARKRAAILGAGRHVFASLGYLGASIDAIARQAGVSTRTIYKHFSSKQQLFAAVLADASDQIASSHEELIDRHLAQPVDLEASLAALATEWVSPLPELADHVRLIDRLRSDAEHLPLDVVETWQEAGPRRVRRTLASHLDTLAQRGTLRPEVPEVAAQYFVALVTSEVAEAPDASAADRATVEHAARRAVHVFLYGYVPRDA
jgi:AcrR family transcriptional regulator